MYIYPITDPEILELGIRMALYREKKPGKPKGSIYPYSDYDDYFNHEFPMWYEEHFIAYLKEPEFRVGERFYYIEHGETNIVRPTFGYITKEDIKVKEKNIELGIEETAWLSHYYPGQEVESFKYVRKIEKPLPEDFWGNNEAVQFDDYDYNQALEKWQQQSGWQEVEEPLSWFPKTETIDFQEDKKQGKIIAKIN